MSHRFSMEEFGEFITLKKQNSQGTNYNKLEENIFNCKVEESKINDDISFLRWEFNAKEDIEIFGSFSSNSLCIMASIDGTINNFDQNSNINTVLNQNEIATVYSKEVSGSEFYKKGEKYRSINILLSDNFIQKYLSEDRNIFKNFNKTNYYKILNKKRMDLKNQMCINSLFQTSMEESLERIKLQSLILEITHSEILDLTNLKEEKKSSQIKFSDFDKEALHKAKEILSNNFKNPPSINQLSKLVHLNEFKLKYGFKFFFNTTPYGIVADMRMEKAKELLEKSYLNINEISLEVGFKHSTNFSKAFFNKYKVLPKDVVKTRSYYY